MALSKDIKFVTAVGMQKALDEEVRLQFIADNTEHLNKLWLNNGPDTSIPIPHLIVSYDMGWQKRSSGHAYNSRSGHGLIIGQNTKKILDYEVKSKHCTQCPKKNNTNEIVHDCVHNFSGTSKSMEVIALKDIMVRCFKQKKFRIKTIICDDDTTMKSNLKWSLKEKQRKIKGFKWPLTPSGATNVKDCGIFPTYLCEPTFLADPSHHKKVIGKHLYKLANDKKSDCPVDKTLAGKIMSDWGYMLHRISSLDPTNANEWKLIKKKQKQSWNIGSAIISIVENGVITIKLNGTIVNINGLKKSFSIKEHK